MVIDRGFYGRECSSISRILKEALLGHSFLPCGFLHHPVATGGPEKGLLLVLLEQITTSSVV